MTKKKIAPRLAIKVSKPKKGPIVRAKIRVSTEDGFLPLHDFPLALRLQQTVGHTFASIRATNLARAKRWHAGGLEEWSTLEWAGAMTGEAGETANVAKKLRRFDMGIQQRKDPKKRAELVAKLAGEIAGTFMYLDLLAQREGIDLRQAIIDEFNFVSARENFPERL